MDLLCSLARAGLGATFLPELQIRVNPQLFDSNGNDSLHAFPINKDYLSLPLVIGYNRNQYFSEISKAFVRTTVDVYRNLLNIH